MKKTILIIGGGILQVPLISQARDLGYAPIVCDKDPHAPGFAFADFPEIISTKDIAQLIECAKQYAQVHPLQGVCTAGTDAAYAVACIAQEIGLPGISIDAALCATNKFLMRVRLREQGVPCPQFFCTSSLDEAREKAHTLQYPLVIKPVDNMGARGVRRLDSEHDLCEQFALSMSHSGNFSKKAVILEEYMHGAEISMDTIVDEQGNIHLLTIADRHIVGGPYFVEIGHSVPSLLPQHILDEAFNVMCNAIRAIGITRGAAKADIKITEEGAKIGEITARLSGGFHSQCTDPLATGMKSTKAVIDLAVGNPLDIRDITPVKSDVAIERALIPESGKIVSIRGVDKARQIEGIHDIFLTCAVGDTIEPLTSNLGKAGHIIAYGKTREEAERAYAEARELITIEMGEKEMVGHL